MFDKKALEAKRGAASDSEAEGNRNQGYNLHKKMSIAGGPKQAMDGGAGGGAKMSVRNAGLNNMNRQSEMAAGINKASKDRRNTN